MENQKTTRRNNLNPKASSLSASNRMKAVKSKNTTPEEDLRRELRALRLSFRDNIKLIPNMRRTADIVFAKTKVAVFLDGCFWHGCPKHGTWPKQNAVFWKEKIEANMQRDKETNKLMRKEGWEIVRIWEHEKPKRAAQKVLKAVKKKEAL